MNINIRRANNDDIKVSTVLKAKLIYNCKDDLIDNEYKETNCFDLHDKEYDLVNRVIGWSVYDWQVEWNVIAPN